MSIEKWRTGSAVQKGELTLDPKQARVKLRDYRLSDPRRWLLEIVAAANLGGASRVRVRIDSDEVMITINGIELTSEDVETLWQAPFQKLSSPVARHIALGLISAESLEPTRIVLRSGRLEANLGPGHNRSLLERITTQLYPDDSAEDSIQIYVKIPLAMTRLFASAESLPEFVYLKKLAQYSRVPVYLDSNQVSSPDFEALGPERWAFEGNGLKGALNLTFDLLRITFIRDGVVTETIEREAVIPAEVVVRTDRVNYDLSGTKVIRDDAFNQVVYELTQFTREAIEARMASDSLPRAFDHIKSRLFVILLTEFVHKRTFFEEISDVDARLAVQLRAHRMWFCAGTPPAGVRADSSGKMLVSLNDALPNGTHLHRSPSMLSIEYGDRAVLLTGRDTNYLTPDEAVARPIIENYLEAASSDISELVHGSQRRIAAEARWRQNPVILLEKRVEVGTYVSSSDRLIQIGYINPPNKSEIAFTHKGNILSQVSGIPRLRILIQEVNPNSHFDGVADDQVAEKLADQLAKVFPEFVTSLARWQPSSPLFAAAHYQELHRLASLYVKDHFVAGLQPFGSAAMGAVKVRPSRFADVPIFSTLTREADLMARSKKLLNLVSGNDFLRQATPLLSVRQLQATGRHLAVCNAAEAERLIAANYGALDPDSIVVVGDHVTEDLLRRIAEIRPMHASSRHREIIGKTDFIAKEKVKFSLPNPRQYALTSDTEVPSGRYLVGLSRSPMKQIAVYFHHEGRLVEEVLLESRGGDFTVVCHDSRLTISSSYQGFLRTEARSAVESEIKEMCTALALKHIQKNSTPVLDSLAAPLYAQLLFSGHKEAQSMEVLSDLNGGRHSLLSAQKWPEILFVRHGLPAAETNSSQPILVLPSSFPETALPKSKDISDTPELRAQRKAAHDRFLASKIELIALSRTFAANAPPEGSMGLASRDFVAAGIQGVVGLVGLKRSLVRVTVLHQGRHVGTHTLTTPFAEFEAVVNIADIELDPLYTEIKSGGNLADDLIKEHCGAALLAWLKTDDCHLDSIRAVRAAGMDLVGWSSEHVRAATNLSIPKPKQTIPEEVAAPKPEAVGPEHACFRFLEEIRGDSNVFGNVAIRGFELKALGTGLPSQAEGNVVQVDPTHPTNKLALETDDPVWRAMLVSSAFTSLNLKWLAITDDHEEEFHTRMLDYMAKALRPVE